MEKARFALILKVMLKECFKFYNDELKTKSELFLKIDALWPFFSKSGNN